MSDEKGYIKFNCIWEKSLFSFPDNIFNQLNHWRKILYNLKLVGSLPEGIGYGNLSMRHDYDFIITGSATGNKNELNKDDYSLVTGFNFKKNEVTCSGLTKASAESLSHAAIYQSNSSVNAVIHIHSKTLWEKYRKILPVTDSAAEYGTPQMAESIIVLFKNGKVGKAGIIIMGGHEDGILSFGKTIDEAGDLILKL